MRVYVPTPLRSYTQKAGQVEQAGSSLREVLDGLDQRFPGLRFRIIDEQDGIREHIKLFVNADQASKIDVPVADRDDLHIICALSGG